MVLVGKNLSANAGDVRDVGLIPGTGRSPGSRHSNPVQYSCLENPMDRGAWWATVGRKGWTQVKREHTCPHKPALVLWASIILMKAVSPCSPYFWVSSGQMDGAKGNWTDRFIPKVRKEKKKKESFQELYEPCIDLCPRCGEFISYLLLLDD